MKKHRKLLALLVALTFLFSVAAPVMAAPAAEEKAAGTLNALGIIEGYPDGTFGLDREITRAEFAKIAVVAAGFGDAGNLMKNSPSKFSDVATGEWYTGWVNVASAQGFVKGDPAGTFRPNDKINYAEVLTVLLRLVGYNDNLPGDWPMNYLSKAVQIGVTKGVSFDASSPAIRGGVFVLAEKTLDVPMVDWKKSDEVFEENGKKLVSNSFKGEMEEGLVRDITWDRKGNAVLDIDGNSYNVAANAVVVGAEDVFGLLGSRVDFVVNDDNDDEELVYAAAKTTNAVTIGAIANDDSSGYYLVAGKRYIKDAEMDITYFPKQYGTDDLKEYDKFSLVLNKKGEIEWAFGWKYEDGDVIDEIDGDTVFGVDGLNVTKKRTDNMVVIRDGAMADFSDLREGDLFYNVGTFGQLDKLVIASSEVKSGVVDVFTKDGGVVDTVTIDSTKYTLAADALISDDNGKNYSGSIDESVVDKAVDFMLAPSGRLAVFVSSASSTGSGLYGIFQADQQGGIDGNRIKIFTQEGKSVIYNATGTAYAKITSESIAAKDLVTYELNSKGQISDISLVGDVDFGDVDGSRIEADDSPTFDGWARVTSSTLIFKGTTEDGVTAWTLVEWADAKDAIEGETNAAKIDGNRVVAVAYEGEGTSGLTYGVIAGSGYNAKGFYYDVFVNGEKVRYNTVTEGAYAKKAVVEFNLVDGKMDNVQTAGTTSASDKIVARDDVNATGSDFVKVGANYYDLSKDVTIVDNREANPALSTRIPRGTQVELYGTDAKGNFKLVVIY